MKKRNALLLGLFVFVFSMSFAAYSYESPRVGLSPYPLPSPIPSDYCVDAMADDFYAPPVRVGYSDASNGYGLSYYIDYWAGNKDCSQVVQIAREDCYSCCEKYSPNDLGCGGKCNTKAEHLRRMFCLGSPY